MKLGLGNPDDFRRLRRHLLIALAALTTVTVVGVIGYTIIGGEEYGLLDAVYMTLITLTTVGYNEVIDLSGNPAGRVFTIALLIGGLAVVLYTVPLVGAFIIEGEIFNAFARHRMDKRIARLSGHYIVCGDTAAAAYVVDELHKTRRECVLVRPETADDEDRPTPEADVPYLIGDPSDDATMQAAGIDRSQGVVAAMDHDKDNILVALTARRLAPTARIVAATERRDTEAKLRAAGTDVVVSPSQIGGLRMASELIRPHVVTFLDRMVRDEANNLRVEEVTVPPDSHAVGRSIADLGIDGVEGTVLLAVRDAATGAYRFRPPHSTAMTANTTLVVMADPDGREELARRLR